VRPEAPEPPEQAVASVEVAPVPEPPPADEARITDAALAQWLAGGAEPARPRTGREWISQRHRSDEPGTAGVADKLF
jgi:hypothetical protein